MGPPIAKPIAESSEREMVSHASDHTAGSDARILEAERAGLRLAVLCRTVVTGLAAAWYLGIPLATDFVPRLDVPVVLAAFTLLGLAYARIVGTAAERWWMKYAFFALDVFAVCAVFAFFPVSGRDDVPQIIAFRAYGIYYLFPLVALSTLALSWRLVAWTGAMVAVGWWAAFAWIVADMERRLSWRDIPFGASRADYESVFLSIDFIGIGNRLEETGLTLAAALILALGVWRARRVFRRQIAAEAEREREREARERVRSALGAYVPEAVADRLVEEGGALEPQTRHAAVLALDVAGFTNFAAGRGPREVIDALGRVLEIAGETVAECGGVVVTYTGDGFLAAFGLPLPLDEPERAAVESARAILMRVEGFDLRIGIAAGPVSAGTIGGRARAFTIYGETVNRAARLEAVGKETGAAINADGAVANAAGGGEALGAHPLQGLGEVDVFGL